MLPRRPGIIPRETTDGPMPTGPGTPPDSKAGEVDVPVDDLGAKLVDGKDKADARAAKPLGKFKRKAPR